MILTLPVGVWIAKAIGITGNLGMPAWLALPLCFILFSLAAYAFWITAQLKKYKRLYRSQSDITESIASVTSTLNKTLEEINALGNIEPDK